MPDNATLWAAAVGTYVVGDGATTAWATETTRLEEQNPLATGTSSNPLWGVLAVKAVTVAAALGLWALAGRPRIVPAVLALFGLGAMSWNVGQVVRYG